MNIRRAAREDAKVLSRLAMTAFMEAVAPHYGSEGISEFTAYASKERFGERFSAGNIFYLAESGGEIVGQRPMDDPKIMECEPAYSDSLVTITEDEIIFQDYYFPRGKRKVVRLADVEFITVKQPTWRNGKWRLHGTGDFKTWFPKDNKRFKRDRIFFVKLKNKWVRIGFTVEDGVRVEKILRDKNLVRTE